MEVTNMHNSTSDWEYSFEDIDNFKDLNNLVHIIITKINKIIPESDIHFFTYSKILKEFREEDKEVFFSITEDNSLITYLALKNTILDKEEMLNDPYFQDMGNVDAKFIIEQLDVDKFIPFVYRFRLLGFLAIKLERENKNFTKKEKKLLKQLQEVALLNLNAALLVDERFAELAILSELGKEISHKDDINVLCKEIFNELKKAINFKVGVLWLLNEDKKHLRLAASVGIPDEEKVDTIVVGEGISGYSAKTKNPVIIKNLKDNHFFMSINKEVYLKGSIISLPLRTKKELLGSITLSTQEEDGEYTNENMHLASIIAHFVSVAIENLKLYGNIEQSYFDTINALTGALDAKDHYTSGHSERVMQYSEGISNILGLEKDKISLLKYAALLHDIGKIGISGSIIGKTGKLNNKEFEIMKKHPIIGEQIIAGIAFLEDAKLFVKYHHERVDGKGYFGLKGDELPYEAKILAVADSYDAMNSDRSYRRALGAVESVRRLQLGIGTQFEGEIVEAFEKYLLQEGYLPENYQEEIDKKNRETDTMFIN